MRFLYYLISIVFNVITTIRNLLFDHNILKIQKHDIPIICVGNLAVGGTGKTPQINYIINTLKKDFTIAVISKGYKRKSKEFIYVNKTDLAEKVGDEPLLIKQKHENIIVAVDHNRNNAVRKIINEHPATDVILLDDAFQHRWIYSNINILITRFDNPFYNDYILPYGSLRESKKASNRADIIIISNCSEEINIKDKKEVRCKLDVNNAQDIYFSKIKYNTLTCLKTLEEKRFDKNYSVTLITGISYTQSLTKYLRLNYAYVNHLKYKDHHNYNLKDFKKILEEYNKDDNKNKIIITTEKDGVKLKKFLKHLNNVTIYVLPIEIIFEKSNTFENRIINYVKSYKRSK